MKFKFNDLVKVKDEFYGEITGVVKEVDIEKDYKGNKKYIYFVYFILDGEIINKRFPEDKLK